MSEEYDVEFGSVGVYNESFTGSSTNYDLFIVSENTYLPQNFGATMDGVRVYVSVGMYASFGFHMITSAGGLCAKVWDESVQGVGESVRGIR